jgi:N-glycosidase YbiA
VTSTLIASFRGEYYWLSNFFPAEVDLDGVKYRSVEHAYAASKTLDRPAREKVRVVATPVTAKHIGKRLPIRPDWEDVKLQVMNDLLHQKFAPGSELAAKLLATRNAHIEEANRWGDRFWGTFKGEGANHLGRLLMQVRAELCGVGVSNEAAAHREGELTGGRAFVPFA